MPVTPMHPMARLPSGKGPARSFGAGFAASILLHAAVIALAIFGLPHLRRPVVDDAPLIPVEIVTIADVAREQGKAPEQKDQAPQPEVQNPPPQEAQSTPAPAEAAPDTDAVPLPDANPREKPKQPEKAVAANVPGAMRTKPEKPSAFNVSRISALLDKSLKEDSQAKEQKTNILDRIAKSVTPSQRETLTSRFASATIAQYIASKAAKCWSPPGGSLNASKQIVILRVRFRENGTLMGPVEIVEQATAQAGEAARRAVLMCAPYDKLPKDQYEVWRDVEFTFDPSKFTGM